VNHLTVTGGTARPGDRARRLRSGAVPWARGTAGVAVFLLLAEAAGRLGLISRAALPLTSAVLARAVLLAGNPRFLADFGATVEAWAAGMAITVAAGVPLGVLLGSLPGVRAATTAIVEFLRPIPSVALILLVSLLLGPGLRMSVTLIVYGAIWPVLYNTIAGIGDADPLAKETNLAFGFSRLATIRMVSLPSAAPFIATGVRVAASFAFVVAVAVELIGTGMAGIGAFAAQEENGAGDLTVMIAIAVWAGLIGLAVNAAFVTAERRLFGWHFALTASAGEQE
jgi:NitT/TauT family transport system permease protein